MSENQDNFELYTKLIAKICETKLTYLISKDVKFEFLGQEESKIVDKKIQLEKDALSLAIPLETLETSLIIYSDLDKVSAISDIFAGGDGQVDIEITDSQQMVYLDTATQFLTSVFKYLLYKNDDLQLAYGETRDQVLEAQKENELDMFGNMDATAFRLKLTIDEANSIELVVNIDKARYETFLEKVEGVFPAVNLDTIGDQLKKEMSSVKTSSKYDLEPGAKNNKEDSLYVVDESRNLDFISDVNLDLIVELGRVDMEFSDVLNLTKGSAIELDRHCSQSVDLYVHNQLVAKGEVIAIDDCFGLKVTEILGSINLFRDFSRAKAAK